MLGYTQVTCHWWFTKYSFLHGDMDGKERGGEKKMVAGNDRLVLFVMWCPTMTMVERLDGIKTNGGKEEWCSDIVHRIKW